MLTIEMLDERVLRLFPEATVLAVLHAALAAAELALRVEHPTADELPLDPRHDIAPSLLTAHLVLSRSAELRHLLQLYSAAVVRAVDGEAGSVSDGHLF